MNERDVVPQIDAINQKLDLIIEEIEYQRRHRKEMEDLKNDLMRIGKDIYRTALVELEEVHDSLSTGDMLHLGKKLLRNVRTISTTIEQLENFRDFFQDFSPVARNMFIDLMNTLDEFDRQGYFAFGRELRAVADKVVTSFSVDDVRHLGENVVTILNTVKHLTQPDMLHAVNNALSVYKTLDINVQEDISLLSLLREFNTPEARRGMTYMIRFFKALAAQQATGEQPTLHPN
jgi:uncharacterized protein YjgD (DUF1641 family)